MTRRLFVLRRRHVFLSALAATLVGEMKFIQSLAQAGKIIQGLIVAEKTR